MSVSKGNELLQDLYHRLTGHWYHEGKYAGQSFNQAQVKELMIKILKEYDDDSISSL
jgi:hypothetical protein